MAAKITKLFGNTCCNCGEVIPQTEERGICHTHRCELEICLDCALQDGVDYCPGHQAEKPVCLHPETCERHSRFRVAEPL